MNFHTKINKLRPLNEQKSLSSSLESDRGRIINSAALRRLQQKTQVFPLERNAAVRSRLTHSLEVQQNGRFIAQTITKKLMQAGQENVLAYEEFGQQLSLAEPLVSLVEMACLMHDIGNPAFGHFGEAAINDWFTRYLKTHSITQSSNDPQSNGSDEQQTLITELTRDLCNFEGNAQAIRIIHRLSSLNLTYCQSASILKYTRCGTQAKPNKTHPLSYIQKKVGFYFSEQEFVSELCDKLNIKIGHRHPASYIMEAADDIAYCLADMEDAVEKGIINVATLMQYLIAEYNEVANEYGLLDEAERLIMQKKCDYAFKKATNTPANFDNEFFIWLRVGLVHPLVEHASNQFIANLDAVFEGSLNQALLEDGGYQNAITTTLKRVALKHVFSHSEVEKLELQGYKIISTILNEYQRLLDLSYDEFQMVLNGEFGFAVESRLLNLISDKFIAVYRETLDEYNTKQLTNPIYEFYARCRLIQDFVSGMTDQFAYDTYRTLMVID